MSSFTTTDVSKSLACLQYPDQLLEMKTSKADIKCYCLSDIHADSEKSIRWIETHCRRSVDEANTHEDTFSIFIIPGDIGSSVKNIQRVFHHLTREYDLVCYIPGNHEAWTSGSMLQKDVKGHYLPASDSVTKLREIYQLAAIEGVITVPIAIEYDSESHPKSLFLFPLQSWYHSSFDTEPDLQHPLYLQSEEKCPFDLKWGDFRCCQWPESLLPASEPLSVSRNNPALAKAFAQLNEPFLYSSSSPRSPRSPTNGNYSQGSIGSPWIEQYYQKYPYLHPEQQFIISFSHFVPRIELTPEKRFLLEPQLSKVIGSQYLEHQIRRLQPHIHLFGHTHIPMDRELDRIVYIQWPLGYSREAERQCAPIHQSGPLCVFDSHQGTGPAGIPKHRPSLQTHWTKYYSLHNRDPENISSLAPWVTKRLETFL